MPKTIAELRNPMTIQSTAIVSDGAQPTDATKMHPAVTALLAGIPGEAAVEAFVNAQTFPLIQPGVAVFAWRGEAERVDLVRWIHAGIDRNAFHRVPGTDLWLLELEVEDYGRFEYKIAVNRHGHEEWMLDGLNPSRAGDPFGENSVCSTYGYQKPDWTEDQDAPGGRFEHITVESDAFGETRHEHIYLPHGYDADTPYPLLVIHDGDDFVTYAGLRIALDNLIAAGDIPPIVVALSQTRDRMGEYPRARRHARYVVKELLPALEARYNLTTDPAKRAMLGASLGAVASLMTAFRFPGYFGGLVLQSGSFILDERKLRGRGHPLFHRVARVVKAVRRAPELPATKAFISTGELEGLADENRALAEFLDQKGVDVQFQSAWDGHHWHNWRDQLRSGLMWVFQPTKNES